VSLSVVVAACAATALVAFGLNAVLTPAVRALAHRRQWYDIPDERKIHTGLIPRLGGAAMLVSALLAATLVVLALPLLGITAPVGLRAALFAVAGIALVTAAGVVDDIISLRPRTKFVFQIAAALVITMGGIQVDSIALPYVGRVEFGVFAVPITVLWFVSLTNAVNFIDGMDGLAGGIAAFAATGMAVIALLQGQFVTAAIAFALLGAIAGFLIYNLPPASIFMGDSGSHFLGFTLALLPLLGISRAASLGTLIVPITLLLIPVLDVAAAIFRRLRMGLPPWQADREHIHHKLLDLGLSDRKILVSVYSVCAYLAIVSVTVVVLPRETELFLVLVVWAGILVAYAVLAYLRNQRARAQSRGGRAAGASDARDRQA
jgi:UDP-GlcNAc:undecaprenyl-phosphate GlcNAc-1-phosphate transferase